MTITGFSIYPFWSYRENAALPEEIIIEQIIQYGEVSDMFRLRELIKIEKIRKVIRQLYKTRSKNKIRINFFEKTMLG